MGDKARDRTKLFYEKQKALHDLINLALNSMMENIIIPTMKQGNAFIIEQVADLRKRIEKLEKEKK